MAPRSGAGGRRARLALLCLVLSSLSACRRIEDEGVVLLVDDSYQASVAATNRDGISAPDGLLWRTDGLYMADEGGSAVRVWRGPGAMSVLGGPQDSLGSPEDLVMDAGHNIYFTDDDAGGLWMIDSLGALRQLAGKAQGIGPTEGIALSPAGTILVGDAEAHRVLSVTRDGAVSVFLGPEFGIEKPESMAFDERGNLYIADNAANVLYQLDPQHELVPVIRQRDGFSPESITYVNGVLYITDSKAGTLYRWTPLDGLQTMAVFRGTLRNIQGITLDDRGDLILSVQSDLKRKVGYLIRLSKTAAG